MGIASIVECERVIMQQVAEHPDGLAYEDIIAVFHEASPAMRSNVDAALNNLTHRRRGLVITEVSSDTTNWSAKYMLRE